MGFLNNKENKIANKYTLADKRDSWEHLALGGEESFLIKKFGVTQRTIRDFLKKHKIAKRSKGRWEMGKYPNSFELVTPETPPPKTEREIRSEVYLEMKKGIGLDLDATKCVLMRILEHIGFKGGDAGIKMVELVRLEKKRLKDGKPYKNAPFFIDF